MNDGYLFKFECNRCGTCCTDKKTIVNLTKTDIVRLKNGLKLDIDELLEITSFYVLNESQCSEIIDQMVIPPIITERGKTFVALRKKEDGSCIFYNLEEKKCRIYSIRPCLCRTFPFSFRMLETKEIDILITKKGKEYCPGLSEQSPFINVVYWKSLGVKALKDLEKNAIFIFDWNRRQKNPTAKKFLEQMSSVSQ
jgi:Fe-S-cluster containining protein